MPQGHHHSKGKKMNDSMVSQNFFNRKGKQNAMNPAQTGRGETSDRREKKKTINGTVRGGFLLWTQFLGGGTKKKRGESRNLSESGEISHSNNQFSRNI